MKPLKKASALVLVCVLLLSCFDITLTASAESIEEAVQFALAIANDDSHGYSNDNRWGPDYDCSSFIISSLKSAGFETGDAMGTTNLKKELCRHGFKWYPWDQIKDVSNLKRGDILLNEQLHTEFYIGRNQNVGAHYDHGNPQTGDQNGQEISVTGYYDNPWDGVLRYTNDIPKVAPTDLEIYANGNSGSTEQPVHFSFFSINAAEQYIDIYKGNERVQHINVTDKYEYDVSIKTSGVYTYRLTASNAIGSKQTDPQKISIFKDRPSDLTVTTDQAAYAAGDTITFKFSAKEAESQYLYISSDSSWDSVDVSGKTEYQMKAKDAGFYSYSFSASNALGYNSTEYKSFSVYKEKPTDLSIYIDNNNYASTEEVTFYINSLGAVHQHLAVSIDGKNAPDIDVTGKSEYKTTFKTAGTYTVTLKASNKFGESSSESRTFKVYASKPGNLTVSADKKGYGLYETVSYSFNSTDALEQTLNIDVDGVRKHSYNVTDETSYNDWYSDPGVYTYVLTAKNALGESTSEKGTFTVYADPPTDVTVSANVNMAATGEEVKFTFESTNADTQTLVIGDSFFDREVIDVTGKTEYTKTFDSAGNHTYSFYAANYNGTSDSKSGSIYIYDTEPSELIAKSIKDEYAVGEQATIKFSAKDAVRLRLNVTLNGEKVVEEYVTDLTKYSFDLSEPGTYNYTLYATNKFGSVHTDTLSFTVADGFTVSYDLGGVETDDIPEPQTKPLGVDIKLSAAKPEREFFTFLGWSSNQDATAPQYQPGDTYSADASVKLYAVWKSDLDIHTHTYKLESWDWDNYDSAAATFTCSSNMFHTETLDALITSTTTEPTCAADGKIVYTATVVFESKTYTDTKEEILPKTEEHSYKLSGWEWDGTKSAKVKFVCENDSKHTQTIDAKVTSEVNAAENEIVYTAKATFEGTEYTDVKTEAAGMMGDLDHDNGITAADALKVLRTSVSLENLTPLENVLADVDGDGGITAADALDILRYSVGDRTNSAIGSTKGA